MKQIKAPNKASTVYISQIKGRVEQMLALIKEQGEIAVCNYARELDGWQGNIELSNDTWKQLIQQVNEQDKADIHFAWEQVSRFANAQAQSLQSFTMESGPGVVLGQKIVPINCAGCYVPAGRYAHVASAIMSVATAKAAGVQNIIACTPPRGNSIHPAIAYALHIAGADKVLQLGGVQAIAAMAQGLFGSEKADIIVGPGNDYVAEAKRLLFGSVGIDVFAGPTESAIIADDSADAMTIAVDLCSQAEHGISSPVWLFTTSFNLAHCVNQILPLVAADMPNEEVVMQAWHDFGEIILCESDEEMASIADEYACEHVQVIAKDLDWWRERLTNYGSLFLGEGSTVTHGDKCVGTNHILPTRKAARYSGGLNVQKFMKILTFQQIDEQANKVFSAVASRISRMEGMEGHARACDWRLRKYFPEENWDFDVYRQKRYDISKY